MMRLETIIKISHEDKLFFIIKLKFIITLSKPKENEFHQFLSQKPFTTAIERYNRGSAIERYNRGIACPKSNDSSYWIVIHGDCPGRAGPILKGPDAFSQ